MKKIELEERLQRLQTHNQTLKLELMLCKLGLTPEMQARFLENALKYTTHAKQAAKKERKKKK